MGDGIRRAYEARVSKPPQYGFSHEALLSRRQILQAACETLSDPSSRREYNLGLAEDADDTIITQVPWDKVNSIVFYTEFYCSGEVVVFNSVVVCVFVFCRCLEHCVCCKRLGRLRLCCELERVC